MKMGKKRVVKTKDFCYTVCTFEGDPRVSPFCKSIVYRFISKGYLPVMFQLFHGRETLLRATGVFSAMAYALLWAGRCKIAVSRQKGRFMAKAYEELTFTDNFMFCKVLTTDLVLCRDILELILDVKIREVRLSEAQKTVEITADARGVRFDVYVEDEKNNVLDLEMQASPSSELPKRSRYYQGMIDLNLIERGALFRELKHSFVIFICLEDYFGKGLPMYTFENVCLEDNMIHLNDEAVKVFINASCRKPDIPPRIKEFLDYLITQKPTGDLTHRIAGNVQRVASNESWRLEYMTFQMKLNEEREEAHEEGRLEGREEGRAEMIITMLQTGKTPEDIHAFCSISLDEILKVKEKLDSE